MRLIPRIETFQDPGHRHRVCRGPRCGPACRHGGLPGTGPGSDDPLDGHAGIHSHPSSSDPVASPLRPPWVATRHPPLPHGASAMNLPLTSRGRSGPPPGVSRENCPDGIAKSQVGDRSSQGTLRSLLTNPPPRTGPQVHPTENMVSGWHARGAHVRRPSPPWVSTSLERTATTRTARQVGRAFNTVSGWRTRNQKQVGICAVGHVNLPTSIWTLDLAFSNTVSGCQTLGH